MAKKKKYKTTRERRPDKRAYIDDIMSEVSKRTGYRLNDVKEVFRMTLDVIIEKILDKSVVELPRIGMFYPMVRPPMRVNKLKPGTGEAEPMTTPAKWVLRFYAGNYTQGELDKIPVTKEEEDNLYRN